MVVSWLVEVAEEFGLQQESLHTAVALLDRFLAGAAVRGGLHHCYVVVSVSQQELLLFGWFDQVNIIKKQQQTISKSRANTLCLPMHHGGASAV